MRRDIQKVFRMTPHDKQVMMFSATLSDTIRPICKKFMHNVKSLPFSSRYYSTTPSNILPPLLSSIVVHWSDRIVVYWISTTPTSGRTNQPPTIAVRMIQLINQPINQTNCSQTCLIPSTLFLSLDCIVHQVKSKRRKMWGEKERKARREDPYERYRSMMMILRYPR